MSRFSNNSNLIWKKKIQQLNNSARAFASSSDPGGNEGVEIGDLRFPSRVDLGTWVDDQLSSLNFPFGVFLDIYSFLARIQTGHTSVGGSFSIRGMLQGLDLGK